MKHVLLFIFSMCLLSCGGKGNTVNDLNELEKQIVEMQSSPIDFSLHAQPESFSATTISGKQFNSEFFIRKNLVVFIYDRRYLQKSDTYDMPQELNGIYEQYKNEIPFIGIVEGFVEDDNELAGYLKNSGILFEQIDNTESANKSAKLNHNLFCNPAKILINTEGKVIYASCGGGSNGGLMWKLDSITGRENLQNDYYTE